MKKLILTLLMIALATTVAEAAAKKKKAVPTPPPKPPIAEQVPLIAIPPLAVAFDLIRRTTCDPKLAVGGGPGFDPEPKVGNFLIPAIYRSQCQGQAQPKKKK